MDAVMWLVVSVSFPCWPGHGPRGGRILNFHWFNPIQMWLTCINYNIERHNLWMAPPPSSSPTIMFSIVSLPYTHRSLACAQTSATLLPLAISVRALLFYYFDQRPMGSEALQRKAHKCDSSKRYTGFSRNPLTHVARQVFPQHQSTLTLSMVPTPDSRDIFPIQHLIEQLRFFTCVVDL